MGLGGLTVLLIAAAARNFDIALKVLGFFYSLLNYGSKLAVKYDMEGSFLSAAKRLNEELQGCVPHVAARVEFVREQDPSTFVRNGKMIIRMRYYDDKAANHVRGLLAYVSGAVIPVARRHVDEKVMKATDLRLARRLLSDGESAQLDYFVDEILSRSTSDDAEIDQLYDAILDIDEAGLFMPVMLGEFSELPKRVLRDKATRKVKEESKKLVAYLTSLARRQRGEKVGVRGVSSRTYSLAVVLVGTDETYVARGIEPYVGYVRHLLDDGYQNIYICAAGRHVQIAEEVTRSHVASPRVLETEVRRITGRPTPATCILIRNARKRQIGQNLA